MKALQNHSRPLDEGTIIDCNRFYVKLRYVKEITSSFIRYKGTKVKRNSAEDIEVVELFTYRDKRGIDGKIRIALPQTKCIHGQEILPFYDLISKDSGFESSLIYQIFRDEHKSYENFICSNGTYYYIMRDKDETFCKRCQHIYNIDNNYCPYCGIRVNKKLSRLKSLLNLFK